MHVACNFAELPRSGHRFATVAKTFDMSHMTPIKRLSLRQLRDQLHPVYSSVTVSIKEASFPGQTELAMFHQGASAGLWGTWSSGKPPDVAVLLQGSSTAR